MAGILITPELVVRCAAGTWGKRAAYGSTKQAQVICVLRAAGFVEARDLSLATMRTAGEELLARDSAR